MLTANPIEKALTAPMNAHDNVIWQALTTRQAHLAEGDGVAKRFIPEISPLAAVAEPNLQGFDSLARLLHAGDVVGVFLPEPYSPMPGWTYLRGAPLLEMVHGNGALPSANGSQPYDFVPLGSADLPQMFTLVKLTEPGPFNSRTHEIGTYLGVRSEGNLVAMAGERLQVPGHTEISAVCTHPEHTGRGYARALMTKLMHQIRARGETPFLHVRQDNVRAIDIYKRLGFNERALLHYAVLKKD